MNAWKFRWLLILLSLLLLFTACGTNTESIDLSKIDYGQESFITVSDNVPQFSKDEITTESFEKYSELDALGRCGVALACIGKDIMPTEERGAIGQVKPTGWQIAKYDIVDGKYLYNRCHLIGYQLTGENANERNLITGTRSMNVDGMLPYENMVADYINETNNHVMYRVTPIYDGDNLLAKGVQMEAFSIEDNGRGISFNVFVFNAQPGIHINYADGTSRLIAEISKNILIENETENIEPDETESITSAKNEIQTEGVYILNTNTKKIHCQGCPSIEDIKEKNRETYNGTKEYLLNSGYTACNRCHP